MTITADTHGWKCTRCDDYGLIDLSPVVSRPTFDSFEWVKQFESRLDRREFRGRDYWTVFDAGVPAPVLDELDRFRFETWTEAMKALRRAAGAAFAKGWKPE